MECGTRTLRHGLTRINTDFQRARLRLCLCSCVGRTLLSAAFDADSSKLVHAVAIAPTANPRFNFSCKIGGQECPPDTGFSANFLRLFLPFPQGSPILHSFCTTQHQFSLRMISAFAQSAHSASVSCIEPAGDCGRAGGDRRFSRVNRREGFQKMRFGAFRKLGRCGLLR